jgi:hypothetical protein
MNMKKQKALVSTSLVSGLALCLLLPACAKAPVTTTSTLTQTLPVTLTSTVNQTVPVTQTTTTTISTTGTVTLTSPVTVIATATAPAVSVTTTVTAQVTTTKTPPTLTQYWPPVTSFYGAVNYYYLPAMTRGQTAYFTLTYEGAPLSFFVLDPSRTIVLSGKVAGSGSSGSGSFYFTAGIDGVYRIECAPGGELATSTVNLFFYIV